jgi:hypothetical protein
VSRCRSQRLSLTLRAEFDRAIQPLADGVPQVAIVRLRAVLAAGPTDEIRRDATAKLGEAPRRRR